MKRPQKLFALHSQVSHLRDSLDLPIDRLPDAVESIYELDGIILTTPVVEFTFRLHFSPDKQSRLTRILCLPATRHAAIVCAPIVLANVERRTFRARFVMHAAFFTLLHALRTAPLGHLATGPLLFGKIPPDDRPHILRMTEMFMLPPLGLAYHATVTGSHDLERLAQHYQLPIPFISRQIDAYERDKSSLLPVIDSTDRRFVSVKKAAATTAAPKTQMLTASERYA